MRCAKAAYHDDEDVDEAINNIIIIRASPFFLPLTTSPRETLSCRGGGKEGARRGFVRCSDGSPEPVRRIARPVPPPSANASVSAPSLPLLDRHLEGGA